MKCKALGTRYVQKGLILIDLRHCFILSVKHWQTSWFDVVGQLLHWLLIYFWAQFKVPVLFCQVSYGSEPGYLRDHLLPYNLIHPLRSSEGPPGHLWERWKAWPERSSRGGPPTVELLLPGLLGDLSGTAWRPFWLGRHLIPDTIMSWPFN